MAIIAAGVTMAGSPVFSEQTAAAGDPRFVPPTARIDGLAFKRALEAASVAWHPEWVESPAPVNDEARMALPVVLEAWRAIERAMSGMTLDDPDRPDLATKATMLRAMYQRLYVDRTRA